MHPDWAEKVEERNSHLQSLQNAEEHKRVIAGLESEKDAATMQWSTAEKSCEEMAARIQTLKTEIEDLKRKKENVAANPVDTTPKQK